MSEVQASQAIARMLIDADLSNPPKTSEVLCLLTKVEKSGFERALREVLRRSSNNSDLLIEACTFENSPASAVAIQMAPPPPSAEEVARELLRDIERDSALTEANRSVRRRFTGSEEG